MAAKKATTGKTRTVNPNRVSAVLTDEAHEALKNLTDAGLSQDKAVSKAIIYFAHSEDIKAALAALL